MHSSTNLIRQNKAMNDYIKLVNITKVYPNGVVANDHVNLEIARGEIHAIAGENGAGKSTIMKILYGAEHADGEIYIDGQKRDISSPRVANELGIGMVYQHFMLVNEFPAWQNVFFGIEIQNKFGFLQKKEMIERTRKLSEDYDMLIDPLQLCGQMSVSTAQKVEILKVLARGAKIIILDEPTAVLTPQETEQLFKQLRLLKENGFTIIIITHKLKEIKEICDRVTIMRQGKTMGVYKVADVSEADISRLMVGRDVSIKPDKAPASPGDVVLEVKGLTVGGLGGKNAVEDVSFKVHTGEILCFAGVEGNGQREVINAVSGLEKNYTGSIVFRGKNISKMKIRSIRREGMSHIPEDRIKSGCDVSSDIFDNLITLDYDQNSRFGFLKLKELQRRSQKQIEEFQIKGSLKQKMSTLSGGNMQKVIIARELQGEPVLVIANQPTRGVDIGAIESIHKELIAMRDAGKAVLLVSADLNEVFGLADRILVFHEGKVTASIRNVEAIDEFMLGDYMLGVKTMENIEA